MALHILVPLDGSDFSREVLGSVHALFAPDAARLTLLRVTPRPAQPEAPPVTLQAWGTLMRTLEHCSNPAAHPVYRSKLWWAFREELTVKLEPRLRALRDRGFAVDLTLRYGDPAEEIITHARETLSDLIVMRTHAYSGLQRVIHESVAETVLKRVGVPVLLAPER